MKELSIKEKAERYEKALMWMYGLYPTMEGAMKEDAEHYFPELKENEDERIKKGIIKYLSWIKDRDGSYMPNNIPFEDMIAWLEKQGGQKSIDDLTQQEAMDIAVAKCFEQGEQKTAEEYNITGIHSKHAEGKLGEMIKNLKPVNEMKVEPKFKIGDNIIAKQETCMEHEPFHITNISDGFYWDGENSILIDKQNEFELYKVESKFKVGDKVECIESFDGFIKGHIYTCKEDGWVGCNSQGDWTSKLYKFKAIPSNGGFWEGYDAAKRELEQEPSWSEEDEKEVAVLEAYIRSKDWSDRHIDRALGIVDELVKKLKSLKDRYTWKPSEEQMKVLYKYAEQNNYDGTILTSLYNDLKQLKKSFT